MIGAWSVLMAFYALIYIARCLACAVSLVSGMSLLVVAYGVDAVADLLILLCPIQWIRALIDRRRVVFLVVVVVALIARAIQFIAGPSAGCVCVRPYVCPPGGPACVLEDLSALQLFSVGMDMGLVGARVACQLAGRCLVRLAQLGPWDLVITGLVMFICHHVA
jgi:hypothetical protein